MVTRIRLIESDRGTGLAGSLMGQQVLGRLIAELPKADSPTPIFLDFDGIPNATASFLRACVLGLRDYVREHRSNLYVIVANAGEVVVEELELVLNARGDAIPTCQLNAEGKVTQPRIVGRLELRQRETLDAVKAAGETDATSLHRHFGAESGASTPTAWNNRLAALVSKGLLMESSVGRSKSYRCVLPGLDYGN